MRRLATRTASLIFCLLALGTPSALGAPPTVVKTTVSKVGINSATLEGEVNPEGKNSFYRFEYGLENCETSACTSIPIPDQDIGAGTSPVSVPPSPISGLTPGTTYHLRIVATNPDGETEGPDRTFATYVPALAGLPDGRAYEQASPVRKSAADARGTVIWVKAADDGEAVSFLSTSGIPGGKGGQEVPAYLATRGSSDWSTQGLLPPAPLGTEALVRGWLTDFSTVFDLARDFDAGQDGVLVSRSSTDGSLEQIIGHGEGLTDMPSYAGASADGSKVILESRSKLSCCEKALVDNPNLYLWDRDSGQVSLIGVLNDEEPPSSSQGSGAVVGPYDWMQTRVLPLAAIEGGAAKDYYTQDLHAISADASRVYFTAQGSGDLYMRINPAEEQSDVDGAGKCTEPALACTIEISATHRTPPDPLGVRPAAFMAATPDAATTFFASPEELTNDANTGPPQPPASIQSADVSGPPILASLPISGTGIATDGKYIYWANPQQDAIGRVELDGGDEDRTFISIPQRKECPPAEPTCSPDKENLVSASPQYVAVDAEHVYWTNDWGGLKETGTIGRADIDGANVEAEWITGANRPKGIAVNATHIFWANAGNASQKEGTIGRANLNGEEVEQRFLETFLPQEEPQGLALDASQIYWTTIEKNGSSSPFSYIDWADLDGLGTVSIEAVGTEPRGIAVDAEHVYWVSKGEEAVGRAKLDLKDLEPQFIPIAGKPNGLAVNATDLYWSVNGEVPPNPGNDLYRYRAGSLLDLTPDASHPNGAEVKGVLDASEDGKRVYFAANGDLDGTGAAEAGNCNGRLSSILEYSGRCNLYLAEEVSANSWSTTFIAHLAANGTFEVSDVLNWIGRGGPLGRYQRTAMTNTDGSVLLFRSREQLTSYDNEGNPELYRYEVGGGGLSCISCNPTGEAPIGGAAVGSIGVSALEPQLAPAQVLSRYLSSDGNRVFFETTDALVIDDTNGQSGCPMEGASQFRFPSCLDVYEWEADGTGSCSEDVQAGGCLYLLSAGTSPNASFFADASVNGEDAFLATRSPNLVRQDQDQLQDIFDVRIDGGLDVQNQAPPVACESLDGCHGPTAPPPTVQSPGSASLVGPGNKKQVRHAAKKRKHKKRHKKQNRKHQRGASHKAGRNSR